MNTFYNILCFHSWISAFVEVYCHYWQRYVLFIFGLWGFVEFFNKDFSNNICTGWKILMFRRQYSNNRWTCIHRVLQITLQCQFVSTAGALLVIAVKGVYSCTPFHSVTQNQQCKQCIARCLHDGICLREAYSFIFNRSQMWILNSNNCDREKGDWDV